MTLNLFPAALIILIYLPILLFAISSKQFKQKFMKVHSITKKQYLTETSVGLIYFFLIAASLFTTITTNTTILSLGLTIYTISLMLTYAGYITFNRTPKNKLITKFPYNISRNPTYFFGLTAVLGITIITMSTHLILLLLIQFILTHKIVLTEEEYLAKKYKKQYANYAKKVRRYF